MSRTVKKTISVTWEPATKFSWEDEGKMYVGYSDKKFEFNLYEDEARYDLQGVIDNADFVEMGYGSNVVFVLPKRIHKITIHSSEETVNETKKRTE